MEGERNKCGDQHTDLWGIRPAWSIQSCSETLSLLPSQGQHIQDRCVGVSMRHLCAWGHPKKRVILQEFGNEESGYFLQCVVCVPTAIVLRMQLGSCFPSSPHNPSDEHPLSSLWKKT